MNSEVQPTQPTPKQTLWYCQIQSVEHGPITSSQLRFMAKEGKLSPDDPVWRSGATRKVAAKEVKGLFETVAPLSAVDAPNATRGRVFISYSSHDKAIADAICHALEAEGLKCWIAPRDIEPGSTWSEAIIDGLEESTAFVLVFSSNTNRSQQVLREVERAISKNIVVVPFRIEDVKPTKGFEYCISLQHWLDAITPPIDGHIVKLVRTVERIISPPRHSETPDNGSNRKEKASAESFSDTHKSASLATDARTIGKGKIVLNRVWAMNSMLYGFNVLLDQVRVGTLRNGCSLTFHVEAGEHKISVKGVWTTAHLVALINPNETIEIEVSLSFWFNNPILTRLNH